MSPAQELRALGAFYGLPTESLIAQIGPRLDTYAEWVLSRRALAVVTLAPPQALEALAGPGVATERLWSAARRWPEAITGIKLDVAGVEAPTLYVRATVPWADGLAWMLDEGLAGLDVPPARTLYGLGFQGDVVKTYALTAEGFVSYRLDTHGVKAEHKRYRAELPWASVPWPDARWRAIGALGEELGFARAGHLGERSRTHELTLYVERMGGIPTDRGLA